MLRKTILFMVILRCTGIAVAQPGPDFFELSFGMKLENESKSFTYLFHASGMDKPFYIIYPRNEIKLKVIGIENYSFVIIRASEQLNMADSMILDCADGFLLKNAEIDSIEYRPGRFTLIPSDFDNKKLNHARWKQRNRNQLKRQPPSSGPYWIKADFINDHDPFFISQEKRSKFLDGPEQCLFACIFYPRLDVKKMWISADRMRFKAAAEYYILENYDTSDFRNYELAGDYFHELYKDSTDEVLLRNHGLLVKRTDSLTYIFRFLVNYRSSYPNENYTYDHSNLLKPIPILFKGDTVVKIIPGQPFVFTGSASTHEIYDIDGKYSIRPREEFFKRPDLFTSFLIRNSMSQRPIPNTFELHTDFYYYLVHQPTQYLHDELTYYGHDTLDIVSYSSGLKGIKLSVEKIRQDYNSQRFEVRIETPSKLILDNKKLKIPLKIHFNNGRTYEVEYAYDCKW